MSKPAKSGQSVHTTSIIYGKSLTVPNTIMTSTNSRPRETLQQQQREVQTQKTNMWSPCYRRRTDGFWLAAVNDENRWLSVVCLCMRWRTWCGRYFSSTRRSCGRTQACEPVSTGPTSTSSSTAPNSQYQLHFRHFWRMLRHRTVYLDMATWLD